MSSNIERADRISRSRALAAPFLGFALLSVQQWLFFGRDWNQISSMQLAVWAVLAIVALLIVLTGGRWLLPRSVRRYVDDDSSRDNRQNAVFGGFTAAMIVALVVFIVSPFEPVDAQRAAHIIISIGLGVSLLSFGVAESRLLD